MFQEALAIQKDNAGALLGMALVAADSYENRAVEFAEKALAADPKLVEARELLARLALEDNNPKKAIEEADKALAISPRAFDAMAIHGTVDWLDGKQDSPWFAKILAADPHYGQGYALAGHIAVLNRRYEEGIAVLPQGTAGSARSVERALAARRQPHAPGRGNRSARRA